ncbi:hypothetical protein BDW22DRAFT_1231377 [Trametopsis cervina]|nr:hypothetical protein BDW22DRAFT_1231377 [Trametopsis cervina]
MGAAAGFSTRYLHQRTSRLHHIILLCHWDSRLFPQSSPEPIRTPSFQPRNLPPSPAHLSKIQYHSRLVELLFLTISPFCLVHPTSISFCFLSFLLINKLAHTSYLTCCLLVCFICNLASFFALRYLF